LVGFLFEKYHTPHERKFESVRYNHRDWQRLYKRYCDINYIPSEPTSEQLDAVRPHPSLPDYRPSDLPVRELAPLPPDEPSPVSVSVIVPIYNTIDFIEQCLDSLVRQTQPDMEIILVDCASTDGSRGVAERYRDQYPQVCLLPLPRNQGPAYARNFGLRHARGKYVGYVDSDDWVEPQMFRKLYEKALTTGADVAICDFDLYLNKTHCFRPNDQGPYLREHNYEHGFQLTNHMAVAFSFNVGWNKLFRRSLLQKYGISYVEGRLFEDMTMHFEPLFVAHAIAVVPEALYHYRREVDGSLSGGWRDKNLTLLVEDFSQVFREIVAFLKKHDLCRTYMGIVMIKVINCIQRDFMWNNSGIDERGNFTKLCELVQELKADLPQSNALSRAQHAMLYLLSPKRLPLAYPRPAKGRVAESVRSGRTQ